MLSNIFIHLIVITLILGIRIETIKLGNIGLAVIIAWIIWVLFLPLTLELIQIIIPKNIVPKNIKKGEVSNLFSNLTF